MYFSAYSFTNCVSVYGEYGEDVSCLQSGDISYRVVEGICGSGRDDDCAGYSHMVRRRTKKHERMVPLTVRAFRLAAARAALATATTSRRWTAATATGSTRTLVPGPSAMARMRS